MWADQFTPKEEDKPRDRGEMVAWDRYAAIVLAGAPAVVIHGDGARDIAYRVAFVAQMADAMLAERRKRYRNPDGEATGP